MHIVQTQATAGWGEQEQRLLADAAGLRARGHDVTLVAPREARLHAEARVRGVPTVELPVGRRDPAGVGALRHFLQGRPVDVVVAHGAVDHWLAALVCTSARSAPPVVRALDASAPVVRNLRTRWLHLRGTGHLVTADEEQRATLVRLGLARDTRSTALPAVLDAERRLDRLESVFRAVTERHRNRRKGLRGRWQRFERSLARRYREWRLPRGYVRLGTRYGGWWVDRSALDAAPLLVDCGLGLDISFPVGFLERFGGRVVGIDPNPESLVYSRERCPAGMEIWDRAFSTRAGETLTFHLPRPPEDLPTGADGISGSLDGSHEYAGGGTLTVLTASLEEVLERTGKDQCDVLKLDIEGAEYPVLEDLCERGLVTRARQLLVEFHHGVTHHSLAETEATVRRVEAAGFRLMHTEDRNYIFRRSDLG